VGQPRGPAVAHRCDGPDFYSGLDQRSRSGITLGCAIANATRQAEHSQAARPRAEHCVEQFLVLGGKRPHIEESRCRGYRTRERTEGVVRKHDRPVSRGLRKLHFSVCCGLCIAWLSGMSQTCRSPGPFGQAHRADAHSVSAALHLQPALTLVKTRMKSMGMRLAICTAEQSIGCHSVPGARPQGRFVTQAFIVTRQRCCSANRLQRSSGQAFTTFCIAELASRSATRKTYPVAAQLPLQPRRAFANQENL